MNDWIDLFWKIAILISALLIPINTWVIIPLALLLVFDLEIEENIGDS